jgi:acyl-CoA thioesterase
VSPQDIAEQSAKKMLAEDRATQGLGMSLVEVRPGYARLRMTVRGDMLNGHAICHGGFIFTLADSAFAFACNSYGAPTVAAGCVIDFLMPASLNDELTAEAVEQAVTGRSGVYDVAVSNQKGQRIALLRGRSRQIRGEK